MVCLAVIWQWLLRGDGGLINTLIDPLFRLFDQLTGAHMRAPNWLAEPGPARMALVIASLWTIGNTVLIFLAALQDVPVHLYESAEIDGATSMQKYLHITLPSISPVIFYCIVSGLIGCLQTFAIPFILAGGGDGPDRSLLFLSTYIFQNAFIYWNMGYACAVAMILFSIVLLFTYILVHWSAKRIHISAD
jgi:multiple sugar transport system permease protein